MSDVILAVAIFHSLSALTLIGGSAVSALRRRTRREILLQSAPVANPRPAAASTPALPHATAHAA